MMKLRGTLLVLIALAIPTTVSCVGPIGRPVTQKQFQNLDNPNELAEKAFTVLSNNCVTCHSPGSGIDSDLPNILDVSQMVTGGIIKPGQPLLSPLYVEMSNGHPDDSNVSTTELSTIYDWIESLRDDFPYGGPAISFRQVYNEILEPYCLSCHSNAGGNEGAVNLETYGMTNNWLIPGNAGASLLYDTVATDRCPKDGPPLSAELKELLFDWIEGGAKN